MLILCLVSSFSKTLIHQIIFGFLDTFDWSEANNFQNFSPKTHDMTSFLKKDTSSFTNTKIKLILNADIKAIPCLAELIFFCKVNSRLILVLYKKSRNV